MFRAGLSAIQRFVGARRSDGFSNLWRLCVVTVCVLLRFVCCYGLCVVTVCVLLRFVLAAETDRDSSEAVATAAAQAELYGNRRNDACRVKGEGHTPDEGRG